jgi:mevalonate kinase
MKAKPQSVAITARAPGKIILSGEHAVVYGGPALAVAVNRFVETTISHSQYLEHKIKFEFMHDKLKHALTLQELHLLRAKIDKRYQDFIAGKCNIVDVIHNPLELIQYAFIYLVENLSLTIQGSLKIQLQSTLPMGCGVGASAAVILSLMHALVNYFSCSLALDKYLHFGRKIENLQHGRSSGLDLFLSLHGGCYFFLDGNMSQRNLPNIPLILVNTGKPQSSTGECVASIAKYFQHGEIGDDFAKVTTVMDLALKQDNLLAVQECIRENHQLLKYIGVVPGKVAKFIAKVEELGSAAKVSGAGAISGVNAGIVLVIGEAAIVDIAKEYGYEILPLQGELRGLQIV